MGEAATRTRGEVGVGGEAATKRRRWRLRACDDERMRSGGGGEARGERAECELFSFFFLSSLLLGGDWGEAGPRKGEQAGKAAEGRDVVARFQERQPEFSLRHVDQSKTRVWTRKSVLEIASPRYKPRILLIYHAKQGIVQ